MFAAAHPDDPGETRYILEEHHGFELCVHTRNFIAGIPVMQNIANAVRMSRRSIVLLTRLVPGGPCTCRLVSKKFVYHD